MPTIESDADADFVGGRPISHGGRGEEVAEAAIEAHCGDNNGFGVPRRCSESLEDRKRAGLFGCYIEIVHVCMQRRSDEWLRGVEKRAGAIYDRDRSGESLIKGCRGFNICGPRLHASSLKITRGQPRRIATDGDWPESTTQQLRHDELSRVA